MPLEIDPAPPNFPSDTLDGGRVVPRRRAPGSVFAVGEVLSGDYQISRLLGTGGMSEVFEAYDLTLRRRVAIKVLRDTDEGELLRKEGQALAAIRHSGLVSVFGLGRHRGFDFLVLELIVGVTLEAHLEQKGAAGERVSVDEALRILLEIASVLAAIHRAGVAHRDVKPGNIMLSGDRVVLMDLGIVVPEVNVSDDPQGVGTPYYMAPEAISGAVAAGAAHLLDVYALGVIAFELCAGRRPFEGDNAIDLLDAHLNSPVPDLGGDAGLAIPPPLCQVVRECMAKNPLDRPPGIEAVAWQLRELRDARRATKAGPRVLILDDDPDAAFILRAHIERLLPGARVTITGSGAEALMRLRRSPADLILMDLNMPSMNGIEFCMHLNARATAIHRPTIISVAAEASPGDLALLRGLGVTHFVPKGPGLPERLRASLGERVGRAG